MIQKKKFKKKKKKKKKTILERLGLLSCKLFFYVKARHFVGVTILRGFVR